MKEGGGEGEEGEREGGGGGKTEEGEVICEGGGTGKTVEVDGEKREGAFGVQRGRKLKALDADNDNVLLVMQTGDSNNVGTPLGTSPVGRYKSKGMAWKADLSTNSVNGAADAGDSAAADEVSSAATGSDAVALSRDSDVAIPGAAGAAADATAEKGKEFPRKTRGPCTVDVRQFQPSRPEDQRLSVDVSAAMWVYELEDPLVPFHGYGGWGDARDQMLCMHLSSSAQ